MNTDRIDIINQALQSRGKINNQSIEEPEPSIEQRLADEEETVRSGLEAIRAALEIEKSKRL